MRTWNIFFREIVYMPDIVRIKTHLTKLFDVKPKEVEWLIPGFIPFGTITLIDGDPGSGKSNFAHFLAAKISSGGIVFSDKYVHQTAVVIMDAEEGWDTVVVKRAVNNGADLSFLYCLNHFAENAITIPSGIELLFSIMVEIGARVLIIDTFSNHLDQNIRPNQDTEVILALKPLATLAAKYGIAVIGLRHLNKSLIGPALYRGGGSIKWAGWARNVFMSLRDPDNQGNHYLACVKSNDEFPETLRFVIHRCENKSSRVEVQGTVPLSADELLRDFAADREDPTEAFDITLELSDWLSARPMRFEELKYEAKKIGVGQKALRGALERIGAVPKKQGFGKSGFWEWALPGKLSPQPDIRLDGNIS